MTTSNQEQQTNKQSALAVALQKIEAVEVPQGKSIALAYSQLKYKARALYAINVDVGQGQEEIDMAVRRAVQLGIQPITIDARKEFTEQWLTKAIQANSDYNGYPVSTSMTRQLIAARVAQKALELGCDALMEGSSGKGNDQYRMHNVFSLFAPGKTCLGGGTRFRPLDMFSLAYRAQELSELLEHRWSD